MTQEEYQNFMQYQQFAGAQGACYTPPPVNPQPQAQAQANPNPTANNVGEQTIKSFMDYLKSGQFREDVNINATRYNVDPKALGNNFLKKTLCTIAGVLGIVVDTSCNLIETIITILANVLRAGVGIVRNVGNAIANVFNPSTVTA